MALRNIQSLQDVAYALKDIDDYLDTLKTQNYDLNGRYIKNIHRSQDDFDAVARIELKDLIGGPVAIQPRQSDFSNLPGYDLRTFGYAIGVDLTTGTDKLPPLIIPWAKCTLLAIYAKAKVAPTGSSAIADINLAGVSIIGSPFIVIPASSLAVVKITTFVTQSFVENQVLTFDMDQVGSTIPGQTLVVTLKFRIDQF